MIEVTNLTKRYGRHTAVNNIDFTISDGEIVGFLGPNGAGKTTTMNIMTGYISATEGTVKINGFDILEQPEAAKRCIGYLPDTPPLYNDMLVYDYLKFVADIKGVKDNRKKMIDEIMHSVRITDVKGRLLKNLSKGYRQRVGLAQAMIGYPSTLILDEPTSGLDPKQIIEMRDVIKKLGKNHTVILSSHILSEVSAVCDRVMIINKGKIVAVDTPDALSTGMSGRNMLVRVKGSKDNILNALSEVKMFKPVTEISSREAGTHDVVVSGDDNIDIREAIFMCMSKNNMPILMMKSAEMSLEEIFLQVTNGEGGNS